MSVSLSDIAILNIKGSNYYFIISLISKNETINLLQNADLTYKLKNIHKYFETIYKNGKTVIKFGDIEIQKRKFNQHEGPISIKNVEIDKTIVPNKVLFG